MKKIIFTLRAPQPVGPYSQAVVAGRLIFTAGQIPIDPETGSLVQGGIREQTSQVLENLRAVLQAAGSDLKHTIKITVFLKNMDDFSAMNEVYASFFNQNPPARSAVEVSRLPRDVLVEIECIAVIPE